MPVRLNGSTSGYTELSAPAVAGSNTLTLPTGNGTSGQALQTNGSGALSWGPGVANDGQLCKAWVNFNGTGTVAIRASYNVSSITDNGTGTYSVNFTNALSDANYAGLITSGFASGVREDVLGFAYTDAPYAPTSSAYGVKFVRADTNAAVDPNYAFVAIFR